MTAAVCDPRFEEKLLTVQREIIAGAFDRAYHAADDIVGCGRSFATKFLYFLAWPHGAGPRGERHLILDGRAENSLTALLKKGWGMPAGFWDGRGRAFTYLWYIRTLATWASAIDVPVDEIERALFQRKGWPAEQG